MKKMQIITVYNKISLFTQMKNSVFARGEGNPDFCEVVGLDNSNNRFPSAAAAYNYALDHFCNAEVLVFCHQDIIFLDHAVSDLYSICIKDDNTLYGAAGIKNLGASKRRERIISSMGQNNEGWRYQTLPKGTTEDVFTLDECLIAANAKVLKKVRFDEQVCDGWHLYAAELCLQCHEKNVAVKVYDANIVHLSGGTLDSGFFDAERKIVEKHRKSFCLITYTNAWTYTDPIRYGAIKLYRKIKYGSRYR